MEYTKQELGFSETDELEKLLFKTESLFDKAYDYFIRNNIHLVLWEDDTPNHHNMAILVRVQDAAKVKPEYDDIAQIKSNLLP